MMSVDVYLLGSSSLMGDIYIRNVIKLLWLHTAMANLYHPKKIMKLGN
jgi:hypothetical protein